jgi:hypothetical protein
MTNTRLQASAEELSRLSLNFAWLRGASVGSPIGHGLPCPSRSADSLWTRVSRAENEGESTCLHALRDSKWSRHQQEAAQTCERMVSTVCPEGQVESQYCLVFSCKLLKLRLSYPSQAFSPLFIPDIAFGPTAGQTHKDHVRPVANAEPVPDLGPSPRKRRYYHYLQRIDWREHGEMEVLRGVRMQRRAPAPWQTTLAMRGKVSGARRPRGLPSGLRLSHRTRLGRERHSCVVIEAISDWFATVAFPHTKSCPKDRCGNPRIVLEGAWKLGPAAGSAVVWALWHAVAHHSQARNLSFNQRAARGPATSRKCKS